jgi:hypothetical protein
MELRRFIQKRKHTTQQKWSDYSDVSQLITSPREQSLLAIAVSQQTANRLACRYR